MSNGQTYSTWSCIKGEELTKWRSSEVEIHFSKNRNACSEHGHLFYKNSRERGQIFCPERWHWVVWLISTLPLQIKAMAGRFEQPHNTAPPPPRKPTPGGFLHNTNNRPNFGISSDLFVWYWTSCSPETHLTALKTEMSTKWKFPFWAWIFVCQISFNGTLVQK